MSQQNYSNHIRWSVPYHFVTVPVILIGTGISVYNFYDVQSLTNGLLILAFILIGIAAGFARFFSLTVQNRAARTDERLRYYILTQKMLPEELGMGQILALRFASDEELPALVERTLTEHLSPTEIKKKVKDWRGDYHRI